MKVELTSIARQSLATVSKLKGSSLISLNELTTEEIFEIIELTSDLKEKQKNRISHHLLPGRTLGMLFAKPSTRTRVSFEVGMYQLGGTSLYLGPNDLHLNKTESVSDTAKTLSRYLDAIMIRTFNQQDVVDLAKYGSIPVINGLTDLEHPCQVLTDLFTIFEEKKKLKGLKLAYVGDGNNVASSLLHGCSKVGIDITVATPKGYQPPKVVVNEALENAKVHNSKVKITDNPLKAVTDADIIYTDTWVSMGQEKEAEEKTKTFSNYQVNKELVAHAKEDYLFMHCLPAHRGYEVTDEVADSTNSVIFDTAENRLHVQKAILTLLIP